MISKPNCEVGIDDIDIQVYSGLYIKHKLDNNIKELRLADDNLTIENPNIRLGEFGDDGALKLVKVYSMEDYTVLLDDEWQTNDKMRDMRSVCKKLDDSK